MSTSTLPEWAKQFASESDDTESTKVNSEFEQLLSETSAGSFVEGECYKGTVISVTDDFVMIDIGYKQEGLVFAKEFRNYDGSLKVKVGDTKLKFISKNLNRILGNLVLSKDKAEILTCLG